MSTFIDLTGRKFGRLRILSRAQNDKFGRAFWNCQCSCKQRTRISVMAKRLRSGHTRSCGCLCRELTRKASTTHGHTRDGKRSKTYRARISMIQRCTKKRHPAYSNYGGRGIKVCRRWLASFQNFLDDMGVAPKGFELDRINNDGNYKPSNCRWATRRQQATNKRSNHKVTINGETMCVAEWSRRSGVPAWAILRRLRRGWSVKVAVFRRLVKTETH